jgi:hypothetical protein
LTVSEVTVGGKFFLRNPIICVMFPGPDMYGCDAIELPSFKLTESLYIKREANCSQLWVVLLKLGGPQLGLFD